MARRAASKSRGKGREAKGSAGRGRGEPPAGTAGRRREILGVVLLALGVTLILALFSFTPKDRVLLEEGYPATHNLIGPVGHHLAGGLLWAIGLGAFVVSAALFAGALACFIRRRVHLTVIEISGYLVLMVFGATLAHLTLGELRPLSHAPGGASGAVAGELLRSWLNTAGAIIVASAVALLALMIASDFTVARLCGTAGRGLMAMFSRAGPFIRESWARAQEGRAERAAQREERRLAKAERAEAKRAKKEARKAEKETKRREREAILREEGTVEADDGGIIFVSGEEQEEEAPPSSRPERGGGKRSSEDAMESTPEPPVSRGRSKKKTEPTAQHERAEVETAEAARASRPHDVGSRSNGVRRRPLPSSPAASIAPADDLDLPRRGPPIDPLADPNWADPEWVGGLSSLAGGEQDASAGQALELPAPAGQLLRNESSTERARSREMDLIAEPRRPGARAGDAAAEGTTPGTPAEQRPGKNGGRPSCEIIGGDSDASPDEDRGGTTGAAEHEKPGAKQVRLGTTLRGKSPGVAGSDRSPGGGSDRSPGAGSGVAGSSGSPGAGRGRADSADREGPKAVDAKETGMPGSTEKPEASAEPQIVAPKAAAPCKKPKVAPQETFAFTAHGDKFVLPSLSFLSPTEENTETELDKEALVDTARRLTEKLRDFGIAGEVVQIRPGPVITMYEFRPGPGVKISKIQSLADDLAMAMEALRVRIVAPIPGKNAVGIEVPNAKRQMVRMREILEQDGFLKSKSKLTLGMGKNIEGDPLIVDLAKMPHLLIAGTTGSGKSVAVNGMITSMLYKSTPEEVRFIMIDPKVLELKLYEGIPHLLLPVVTDPAKAALALRWATEEMDRRYHLLADLNVRDLSTFNRKITRLRKEWEERQEEKPPLPPIESVDGDAEAHEALRRQHEERWLSDPPPPEKLPLLVIVIDELADLMMVASREVETYIARLAQKARAAGIHLLVATQRPSTDVLTGVIKINFPARISFRVASRHDSQTIINEPGAEKLLGNGDMLIIPPGQSEPVRAHGAFLSETEIEEVVEHLKTQGEPVYDESILQPRDEGGGGADEEEDDSLDPKWDEALAILSDRDTISVSWIQRRLAIGYNRAARMIEKMEREGIVGPADGSKPREILMGGPPM